MSFHPSVDARDLTSAINVWRFSSLQLYSVVATGCVAALKSCLPSTVEKSIGPVSALDGVSVNVVVRLGAIVVVVENSFSFLSKRKRVSYLLLHEVDRGLLIIRFDFNTYLIYDILFPLIVFSIRYV